MNDSMKNKADQVIGGIKESIGKAVESEELELKGKLQKTAGEVKEKTEELGKEVKEKLAEKANDLIDSLKKEKND
ncbi:MAG: CsbD family protein [Lacrimispora sp.]|uniref:CsbD family protein n=1 Tax=Lacrimispora sp. TaxID=2719234 RepID=UPI0039E439F1